MRVPLSNLPLIDRQQKEKELTNQELDQLAATLLKPTAKDLTPCSSLAEIAQREGGWSQTDYALTMAAHIQDVHVPLDSQRERLQALGQCGASLAGDQAAAETLAAHAVILEALFHRFAITANDLHVASPVRNSGPATTYLSAALKAQRACMAALSAVSSLRQGSHIPTTSTASPGPIAGPAPALPDNGVALDAASV